MRVVEAFVEDEDSEGGPDNLSAPGYLSESSSSGSGSAAEEARVVVTPRGCHVLYRLGAAALGALSVVALGASALASSLGSSASREAARLRTPRQLLESQEFAEAVTEQLFKLGKLGANASSFLHIPPAKRDEAEAMVADRVRNVLGNFTLKHPEVARVLSNASVSEEKWNEAISVIRHLSDERVLGLGLQVARAAGNFEGESPATFSNRVRESMGLRREEILRLRDEILQTPAPLRRRHTPKHWDVLLSASGIRALASLGRWDAKFFVSRPEVHLVRGLARRLTTPEEKKHLAMVLLLVFAVPAATIASLMLTALIPVLDYFEEDTAKFVAFGVEDIFAIGSCIAPPFMTLPVSMVLTFIPCMIEASFAAIQTIMLCLE